MPAGIIDPEKHEFVVPTKMVTDSAHIAAKWEKSEVGFILSQVFLQKIYGTCKVI